MIRNGIEARGKRFRYIVEKVCEEHGQNDVPVLIYHKTTMGRTKVICGKKNEDYTVSVLFLPGKMIEISVKIWKLKADDFLGLKDSLKNQLMENGYTLEEGTLFPDYYVAKFSY